LLAKFYLYWEKVEKLSFGAFFQMQTHHIPKGQVDEAPLYRHINIRRQFVVALHKLSGFLVQHNQIEVEPIEEMSQNKYVESFQHFDHFQSPASEAHD
jgi:hypothetical protein